MKKDDKEIDIKQQLRIAFRMGLLERDKRLQKRLDCLQKANGYLFDELIKLDKTEPLRGIVVPVELFKKIITRLKKGKQYTYAKKLTKILNGHPATKLEILYRQYQRAQGHKVKK